MRTRPNFAVTNQSKSSQVPVDANSVFVARVTGVSDSGVFVNVPNLAPNQTFGPCQVFTQKPRVGDSVIVGFTDGQRQKMVVLGGENKNFRLVNLDDPVNPQDAATKKYVDDKVAELLAKLIAKDAGYVLSYADLTHTHPEYASSSHTH